MRGAVPAGRHRRRPGRATPHLHAVLGLADGTTHGGHLLEGRLWPKLEVVIKDSPVALAEVNRPELGLALIDLPSACRRGPCPRRPPAEARRRGSSRVAVGRQHPSGGTGRSFRDHGQPADEEPVRPSTGAGIASGTSRRAFDFAGVTAMTVGRRGPRPDVPSTRCEGAGRRTRGQRCRRRRCSTPARKPPPAAPVGAYLRTHLSPALSLVCHQLRVSPGPRCPDLL
ncbi:DUF296 domain-containing protein [Streptomyces sp. NPDC032161]|uniref:PCC domain-containing protein n=1 Tax=unclassified Streptomyces TaxID=2593676 RepID=UPI00340816BE